MRRNAFARVVFTPAGSLEQAELLARPLPAAGPLELGLEPVAKLQQMDGVLRRVVEHSLRQRPHGPVGALMLLVELHPEVPLEQRRETEGANAEELRRDARVEDVPGVPAIVLMQQSEVVVGVVKDDLHRRILEQRRPGRLACRSAADR